MPRPTARPKRKTLPPPQRGTPAAVLLQHRPLESGEPRSLPSVRLRSVRRNPLVYRKLIGQVEGAAQPGDLVAVHSPQGELLGFGLYNPSAELTVRMLTTGSEPPDADWWRRTLERAISLRHGVLRLAELADCYRVVHAEGDGLSGLVVDRYGDVLSVEVFSLAMYQRAPAIVAELAALLGTRHWLVQAAPQTHGQEGFEGPPRRSPDLPREVIVSERGTRFGVRFEEGHKTGFFCDQRENRARLAEFCRGRSVLDLCCYSGGFAIQAARLGPAAETTAVDLDERAIGLARQNARLNGVNVRFVHADVFGYMRDMLAQGRQFEVVVLDPPKLIRNRREVDEGTRAHFDLNRLAISLVAPGGVLLTCTCSGLLPEPEFVRLVCDAASRPPRGTGPDGPSGHSVRGRSLQIFYKSGAAPDHPIAGDCPETEYLKAVWARVT